MIIVKTHKIQYSCRDIPKPILIKQFLFIILLIPLFSVGQSDIYERADEMLAQFKAKHYLPPDYDSAFALRVGEVLLDELDSKGFFFMEEDSLLIMSQPYTNSNGLNTDLDKLLKEVHKTYMERVDYMKVELKKFLGKGSENIESGKIYYSGPNKPKPFKSDYQELLNRWRTFLVYSTYMNLFDLEDSIRVNNIDSCHTVYPKYWDDAVNEEICSLEDYDLTYEEFCDIFMDCLAKAHDPHSTFFTYEETNYFISSISTENMSFGLYFTRNKNNSLEITYLIPGGSAWNSGEINIGDLIISMIAGSSDTLDLSCKDPYDLIDELNNSAYKKLQLRIKKQNGQIKNVTIVKSPVEAEENVITSFILEDDIGYINLPTFYSNWRGSGSGTCSSDMAKEILKLERDNIKGLIVDLRFNGGGSLPEAIDLCGIFIDEGPLCVTHSQFEGAKSIKDPNRGTLYDGPMIILVNTYSASASELFAGIMQDYNRAVVVGDTTYGKGSVQNLYDSEDGSSGVKITTEGFYSIDLKSHQKTGIIPDIVLPNYYYDKPREEKEKFALDFPDIEKKLYMTILEELPIEELKAKSDQRVAEDIYFQNIMKVKEEIQNFRKGSYELNYQGCKEIWDYFTAFDYYDLELMEDDQNQVKNNSYDLPIIDFDETKKEANKYAIIDLKKDIYLRESVKIINDLINL